MVASLWAYLDARRVGRLEHDRRNLRFTYDALNAPALSVRLPARDEPYEDAECRPFFANLLPEGDWRVALCRQLGVAVEDDFGLLAAIGADCAGAVSLQKEPDWAPSTGRYVPTSESELRKWVKKPASRPAVRVTPGLRLSLAGAQDKLLFHWDEGETYLCEGGAPSTAILKPDIQDRTNAIELSALNELLSMKLAERAGLVVPRAFWFASAYAVGRYDRIRDGDRVRRLHQEDLAQVCGVPAAAKYDVTWKECFTALSQHATAPAAARVELLARLVFNLLLGNNDAHAKNVALLHRADATVGLAPAYDLVSTRLYRSLSRHFAMRIGPATTLQELDLESWRSFASDVGVALPFVRQRALELTETVPTHLVGLLSEAQTENPALVRDVYPARRRTELFEKFAKVVTANCRAVARSFD